VVVVDVRDRDVDGDLRVGAAHAVARPQVQLVVRLELVVQSVSDEDRT
jgi:hypothetical protein